MKLEKVTTWSAETPDGAFYAERETGTGQWWKLWNRRKSIGRYRGFTAAAVAVAGRTMVRSSVKVKGV